MSTEPAPSFADRLTRAARAAAKADLQRSDPPTWFSPELAQQWHDVRTASNELVALVEDYIAAHRRELPGQTP